MSEGRFRLPLLQRLGAYEVRIPPLRERRDDIARLLVHFLREELDRAGRADRLAPPSGADDPWIPAWLVSDACRHTWPGNVRELRNLARRLAISSADDARIAPTPAVMRLLGSGPRDVEPVAAPAAPSSASPRALDSYADDEVRDALRRNAWRLRAAARDLGISRTSLYALIHRIPGLRKAGDLTAQEIQDALDAHGGSSSAAAAALEVSARGLRFRMRDLGLDPS